jgi:hypothetical protein
MRIKGGWWALCVAVGLALVLATSIRAWDEDSVPSHLQGVINDYSPVAGSSTLAPTVWEVRGPWQMSLDKEDGTASFIASVTMELSPVDQNSTVIGGLVLSQHTHDIRMKGKINFNPTDCPPNATGTPAYTARFEINGMATVSANGGGFPPPPAMAEPSPLQVCIEGGTVTAYSNVTLMFQAPASGHFGGQAIHGVVRKTL